ncbi:MAG: hypothetical protein PHC34_03135 [Candidatus Gastranaerophilales bacterium]|nr:hypothetical protein [Candidatus Gastranaerophilales bacterium]
MVNSVSSSQSASQVQQAYRKQPSAEEMFKKLTEEVGGDGTSITKDDLNSYISELESDSTSNDKGKLGFLKQLASNFDKVSGGKDSITADDLKSGMEYLKPPSGAQGGFKLSAADIFSNLSSKVGTDDKGITKDDLQTYLKKLQNSGSSDTKETELISKLIEDFDNVSGGTDYITSSSLQNAFQSQANSRQQWQDPSTITSDQLQSPIDIKV